MRIAVPAESGNGLESPISQHFGRCPVFVMVDVEDGEMTSVEEIDNPFYGNHAPGRVPGFIQSQGADVILVGGMGRRALAFFEQYGIEAVTGAVGTVHQAIEGFLGGHLQGVEPCAQSRHHEHHHEHHEHHERHEHDAATSMKIVITAMSQDLDAEVDSRFGRAACFVVLDMESGEWESYANPAREAGGGAGVLAAQFVVDRGVEAVISGNFGPKAYETLAAAGIGLFQFPAGDPLTVREVLESYRDGRLEPVTGATGPQYHGL